MNSKDSPFLPLFVVYICTGFSCAHLYKSFSYASSPKANIWPKSKHKQSLPCEAVCFVMLWSLCLFRGMCLAIKLPNTFFFCTNMALPYASSLKNAFTSSIELVLPVMICAIINRNTKNCMGQQYPYLSFWLFFFFAFWNNSCSALQTTITGKLVLVSFSVSFSVSSFSVSS